MGDNTGQGLAKAYISAAGRWRGQAGRWLTAFGRQNKMGFGLQIELIFGTKCPAMKQLLITLTVWLSVCATQAAGLKGGLLVDIHFAGAQKIGASRDSAGMAPIFDGPEARVLRGQTLDKLARFPQVWLKDYLAAGAVDGSGLLRPLLNDLITSEWHLAVRDSGRRLPEFALAVRLPAGSDRVWEKNLATLLTSWTQIPTQPIPGGWELKKHQPPTSVRFEHFKDWVIFSAWQTVSPLDRQALLANKTSPWLTVDADWQRLAAWLPALKLADLPASHLEVSGHATNLELRVQAIFSGPAPIVLEPWKLPTNTIRQPFNSFTAVRGFAPWLEQQSWNPAYDLAPTPNQLVSWSLPQVPFLSFWAVPVPDAAVALGQALIRLTGPMASANEQHEFFTHLYLVRTNNDVTIQGAPPFVSPFITTLKEPAGQFLMAGLFSKPPRAKPFPANLLTELNKPKLVYYHWELTSDRMPQWLQISQLGLLLTKHQQLDPNSASAKWLQRISPALGPTTTELFASGPSELTGVRAAPAGLTAVELYALANWLEAPNFPGCELPKLMTPHARHLHAPAPAPSH